MTDNPKTSTELVVQKPAIVAVLGAGSWGTALAQILARRGHTVTIWGRETEIVDEINASHSNEFYFPGVKLNPAIRGIKEIDAAVRGAEAERLAALGLGTVELCDGSLAFTDLAPGGDGLRAVWRDEARSELLGHSRYPGVVIERPAEGG